MSHVFTLKNSQSSKSIERQTQSTLVQKSEEMLVHVDTTTTIKTQKSIKDYFVYTKTICLPHILPSIEKVKKGNNSFKNGAIQQPQ